MEAVKRIAARIAAGIAVGFIFLMFESGWMLLSCGPVHGGVGCRDSDYEDADADDAFFDVTEFFVEDQKFKGNPTYAQYSKAGEKQHGDAGEGFNVFSQACLVAECFGLGIIEIQSLVACLCEDAS